jgi:transposase InsO family protein
MGRRHNVHPSRQRICLSRGCVGRVFSEGHWLGSWAKSQIPTSSLRFEASNRGSEAARGVVHHSDQDVQYACQEYVAKLRHHQMLPSMSRPSNPYDNATCESFPRTGFRNTSPGCEASGITRCWELSDVRVMTSAINHTGVIARWLETKCPVRLRLWKMLHVRMRNWSS